VPGGESKKGCMGKLRGAVISYEKLYWKEKSKRGGTIRTSSQKKKKKEKAKRYGRTMRRPQLVPVTETRFDLLKERKRLRNKKVDRAGMCETGVDPKVRVEPVRYYQNGLRARTVSKRKEGQKGR